MKFYKEISTGNWILKGITTTKGIYNMEKVMVGNDEHVRITKNLMQGANIMQPATSLYQQSILVYQLNI